jgi:hypothetical protein
MLQRVIDYNESQSINQSRLKKLLGNEDPKTFLLDIELSSKSITVGSLVDCLLTSPEEFSNDYYVSQLVNLPSDTIQLIVKETFDNVWNNVSQSNDNNINEDINYYKSTILTGETFGKYQPNWKVETKLNKILEEEPAQYFRELVLSAGKQIVSRDDYELAEIVANSMKARFPLEDSPNCVITTQHPIYFRVNGIECKALIDVLAINHETKTVIITDIKTMSGHVLDFGRSVNSFGYNLQMAFYYLAGKSLTSMVEGPCHNYTIKCQFIVESTTNCGTPVCFECTEDFIQTGLYGISSRKVRTFKYNEDLREYPLIIKEQEGILNLLKKYDYYLTNGWQKNQRIVKNNSIFTLDWFGIVD